MREKDIKPGWEVFDLVHLLQYITRLIQVGYNEPPNYLNIVLSGHDVFQGALTYAPEDLADDGRDVTRKLRLQRLHARAGPAPGAYPRAHPGWSRTARVEDNNVLCEGTMRGAS